METSAPPPTTSPTPAGGKRNWVVPFVGLVAIVLAASGIWWFGIRDAGSGPADAIHGTWYWSYYGAYETFDADGEWRVAGSPEGTAYDWGTYTFEDGVLTFFNADDSYCPGAVAVWEVTFSEDGSELREKFVSETCTKSSAVRGRDRTLVRYTP